MMFGAVSFLFAFGVFLNFKDAAAILVKVEILRGDNITKDTAIAGIVWAEGRPPWLIAPPPSHFQRFEVFTTSVHYGSRQGSFQLTGEIRDHGKDRPIRAKAEIGRSNYRNSSPFIIYNHDVELDPEEDGYIFIGIPGSTRVYHAKLRLTRDKVYPLEAALDEGPNSRIALLRALHQNE